MADRELRDIEIVAIHDLSPRGSEPAAYFFVPTEWQNVSQ
jgi:hypothetical protein